MTATRAIAALAVGVTLSSIVVAQQSREASTKTPSGSGVLAGTVLSATDPVVPIRRAIVTISGAGLGVDRSVVTNDDGQFVVDKLPAGSFTVTASKPSYLAAAYGAKRPSRPGTPIALTAGQRVSGISLRLAKGGVITGTVRSGDGIPVPGLQMLAMRAGDPPPRLGLPVFGGGLGSIVTDDRGTYRFYGLEPGSYVVVALVTSTQLGELHRRSDADVDAAIRDAQQKGVAPAPPPATPLPAFAAAPIYFPGTPVSSQAVSIDVTVGSVREDVSFTADAVPSAAVDGAIQRPAGVDGRIQLVISGAGSPTPLSLSMGPRLFVPPGPDGHFRYTNVTPGHYTLLALMSDAPAPSPATVAGGGSGAIRQGGPPSATAGTQPSVWWATADIDVAGSDISGVSLPLQPGMTFAGKLQFDATTTTPPPDLTKLTIAIESLTGGGTASINGTAYGGSQRSVRNRLNDDGTFNLIGLTPGTYRLWLNSDSTPRLLSDFYLRSAMVEDHDVLDTLVTIAPNHNFDHAVVTMTDRHTELSGTLVVPSGGPAAEYYVIALPTERAWWVPNARRIKSARPATDGHFVFTDLPPGSYVLAAVDDLEPSDLADQKFLDALARAGTPVTLGEGEKKRQDVRVR